MNRAAQLRDPGSGPGPPAAARWRIRLPPGGRAVELFPVLLLVLAPGVGAAAHSGPLESSFSISLSATPSTGPAPLPVSFEVTVLSGSPSTYNWSFGDGTYLNGTNSSDASPTHVYSRPGSYTALVEVHEGSDAVTRELNLSVTTPPLSGAVSASVSSGTVPLTVLFQATVAGGSGTYLTLRWDFGDGGVGTGLVVRYTFERAGSFHVTFTANDTQGDVRQSSVDIHVNAVAVSPQARSIFPTGLLAGWVALSFAVGVAVALSARWGLGRRSDRQRRELDLAERTLSSGNGLMAGSADGPWVGPPDAAPTLAASPLPSVAGPNVVAVGSPSDTILPPVRSEPASPVEGLRVSQRIVLHLAGQGALRADDVATLAFTQSGMAAALGIRQNALTNVLRRLLAAGVLTVDVRHVTGQPRRLKVYALTARGEALARDLRSG
ncbi:MAG: PKD domain-containing protein [Thermoplasmata archaeon]|nr:PKD domain-containing protein [Thermoplasmata archaeon]